MYVLSLSELVVQKDQDINSNHKCSRGNNNAKDDMRKPLQDPWRACLWCFIQKQTKIDCPPQLANQDRGPTHYRQILNFVPPCITPSTRLLIETVGATHSVNLGSFLSKSEAMKIKQHSLETLCWKTNFQPLAVRSMWV